MKVYGDMSFEGDESSIIIGHGASYPTMAQPGELFFHTLDGLVVFKDGIWNPAASALSNISDDQIVPNAVIQTSKLNDGDQFVFKDGSRPFTGTIAGITPTADTHLATKGYIDGKTITITGDATGSSTIVDGSIALTLASSGVTPGTYSKITVDSQGRVTVGTTLAAADIPSLDWSKITTGKPTTLAGYGITDAQSALGFTPLNKAGDNILGSLSFPKTSGIGIKIENAYGWCDLIGDIAPRDNGSSAATLRTFIGSVREFSYMANDQGDTTYHIPHDYAPGTDLFIHAHWGHNGTSISGTFEIQFNVTFAKGHNQEAFITPITATLTVPNLTISNSPQYIHRVDEIQLSIAGGGANLLNSNSIEVDGLLLINYVVTSIPTISGGSSGSPFIFTIDLHYQSTSLPTKNKSPSFYA